jgi:hypothetical protein
MFNSNSICLWCARLVHPYQTPWTGYLPSTPTFEDEAHLSTIKRLFLHPRSVSCHLHYQEHSCKDDSSLHWKTEPIEYNLWFCRGLADCKHPAHQHMAVLTYFGDHFLGTEVKESPDNKECSFALHFEGLYDKGLTWRVPWTYLITTARNICIMS